MTFSETGGRGRSPSSPNLFRQTCTFIKTVVKMADLPDPTLPEVAFVGRSNVGKSSLINALVNQKNLARASVTPGRTQALNFFQLGSAVYLVDLPGYGYAKAPIGAIEAWLALIESYLTNRTTLKRVYVLVDSRHGLKDSDVQMLTFLTALGQSHQIILTKTDKISKKALEDLRLEVEQRSIQFPALHPEVHAVSALKKDGVQTLQQAISALINLG